jgi:hypothetical protein
MKDGHAAHVENSMRTLSTFGSPTAFGAEGLKIIRMIGNVSHRPNLFSSSNRNGGYISAAQENPT